jgi:hypothetical protein
MGLPPESVFIVTILVSILVQIAELLLLKQLISYSIKSYLKEVVLLGLSVMLISGIIPYFVTILLVPGFIRFLIVGFTSVLTTTTLVYFIGIDLETRNYLVRKIKTTLQGIRG